MRLIIVSAAMRHIGYKSRSQLYTLINEDLVELGHLAAHIDHLDDLPEIVNAFTPELAESKTGIPAATVRDLAREMINAEGAVCYGRMGASVQQFGALCQWAIQVINILSGNPRRSASLPVRFFNKNGLS